MYKGSTRRLEESSINRSTLNSTVLSETTNQLIEREIDNYTRMLEQDKRKFFRVQEGRNETIKEFTEKTRELENLLGREFKSETMKRRGEVKILERELEQGINSYNEVIANNKQLKADIDELRKEKLNQKEAMRRLTLRLADHHSLIAQKQEEIASKKEHIQLAKQDILKLKMQNEGEAKEFREEVTGIKGNLRGSKSKNYLFKRKSEMDQKNEATDTQPLVRYRLRVLIGKNKERMRIIENYRKTMTAIWKSFEEIKEESGIGDIEEITNTFIKHEQQNHFIYEYINKLNKEIEDLQEQTQQLTQKIREQKETNDAYAQQLGPTPQKISQHYAETHFVQHCQAKIDHFEHFLKESEPIVREVRRLMGEEGEEELTQFNVESQLAKIESMIN